jgi:cell wall-associated NlpC family hydrolase
VTGQAGGFYKTVYKHQTVYISAAYTYEFSLEKSPNEQVEQVIEQGYSLIGVPYVYGAVRLHDGYGNKLSSFNKNKFDCSSLTQFMFYYGAGVLLSTTTRTQVKQGEFVKKSELSRGDCIYYTNETRFHLSGTERIGHVAVYLGDGFILHTASDFARIEKMSSTRWSYYIEARRFL